jgi:tRNA (cmo5U34)-methyltransferase
MVDSWVFDEGVAKVFDDMLERSIPDYANMRDLCFRLGKNFVTYQDSIVDLGASRGNAIAPFIDCFGPSNHYYLIEKSEPMYNILQSRFCHLMGTTDVRIYRDDIRDIMWDLPICLTLSVLTMQFVPITARQRILDNIAQHTVRGGAFIMVEKVLGETGRMDDLFVKEYHHMKERNGYSQEEITRKALQLENVLIPVTVSYNMEMLRKAGFREVEIFWKSLNFVGIVAIK